MRKLFVLLTVLALLVSVAPSFAQSRTITDIVVGDNRFDTLQAAVVAAGLADTLASAGPFTVFAPTDTAFAAIPESTLNSLLADPSGTLTQILLYHVVSGSVPASQVVTLQQATTVQGSPVKIEVTDDGVVLDRSVNVIITDIAASNGIIHVIDTVLMPPMPVAADSELIQIVNPTLVQFSSVGGDSNSVLPGEQTFLVTELANGAYKLRDLPGWVIAADTRVVPRNFGQ
jgi:uncharacterized surface protein with fasciclin (FAS1) repeats